MLQPVRGLALAALLCCCAGPVLAQSSPQEELNAITGAPAGTRCFKSVRLAQEFAKRYTASGICPQLRPMDPGQFLSALEVQNAVDKNFHGRRLPAAVRHDAPRRPRVGAAGP